jgi:hypothetical protein
MTLKDFKVAVLRPITVSGIKTLPGNEDIVLIYNLFVEYFPRITVGQLHEAFDINAVGNEWKRIEHYGLFGIQYLSDVLREYYKYTKPHVLSVDKKRQEEERNQEHILQHSSVDPNESLLTIIYTDGRRIQEGHDLLMADLFAPIMINRLYTNGIIDDSWLTDEQWKSLKKQAKVQAVIRPEEAMRLRQSEMKQYRADKLRREASQLFYRLLLTDQTLNDKLINKLKQ